VKNQRVRQFIPAFEDSAKGKYLILCKELPGLSISNFDSQNLLGDSILSKIEKSGLNNSIIQAFINKKFEGNYIISSKSVLGFHFYIFMEDIGEGGRYINTIFFSSEVQNKINQFIYWKGIEEKAQALIHCLGKKDAYTAGHTKRVGLTCRDLAKLMGLSDYDTKVCYYSGLLHDIGKIGIDDRILSKSSALTDGEFLAMKEHPKYSYEILKGVIDNKDIIDGVRFHHEKFDGSGYPLGLKSEEIPLSSRIVSVADTFDALISHRPYRRGVSPSEALKVVMKIAPGQLDEDIVQVLIKYVHSTQMIKKSKKAA
tara:strand:- start:1109 stop:2047 length:939 start_codon:yes stop_codon:yes gene_type:complete